MIQIVPSENDFPLMAVDSVRVGSAHAESPNEQRDEHLRQLLAKVSSCTNAADGANEVVFDIKLPEPPLQREPTTPRAPLQQSLPAPRQREPLARLSAMVANQSAEPLDESIEPRFEEVRLSTVDRQHLRNLYLCIRLQGRNPRDETAYCYFGLFADQFLQLAKDLNRRPSTNPKDYGAIVLARSAGEPTPEIRAFMRMKFSFSEDQVTLEISRGKSREAK